MVALRIFDECLRGQHKDCPRCHSSPGVVFGGSLCTCRCHSKDMVDEIHPKGEDREVPEKAGRHSSF